jgi:hypothetical protein
MLDNKTITYKNFLWIASGYAGDDDWGDFDHNVYHFFNRPNGSLGDGFGGGVGHMGFGNGCGGGGGKGGRSKVASGNSGFFNVFNEQPGKKIVIDAYQSLCRQMTIAMNNQRQKNISNMVNNDPLSSENLLHGNSPIALMDFNIKGLEFKKNALNEVIKYGKFIK